MGILRNFAQICILFIFASIGISSMKKVLMQLYNFTTLGRPKFRRSRTIFSPEQLEILEEQFTKYKYPDVKHRHLIAEEVGLSDERVQVWFQNRRAKNKRQTDQQVKLQKLVSEAISTGNQCLEKPKKTGEEGGTLLIGN